MGDISIATPGIAFSYLKSLISQNPPPEVVNNAYITSIAFPLYEQFFRGLNSTDSLSLKQELIRLNDKEPPPRITKEWIIEEAYKKNSSISVVMGWFKSLFTSKDSKTPVISKSSTISTTYILIGGGVLAYLLLRKK